MLLGPERRVSLRSARTCVVRLATVATLVVWAIPAVAATVTFDFDGSTVPSEHLVFAETGVTVTITPDPTVSALGSAAQAGAPTFQGSGSVVLSSSASNQGPYVGAYVDFSTNVFALSLYAAHGEAAGAEGEPFVLEAYDAGGTVVGTASTTRFDGSFELIKFAHIEGIRRLRLIGLQDVSVIDELTLVVGAGVPVQSLSFGAWKVRCGQR